jgi:hypothetical protein
VRLIRFPRITSHASAGFVTVDLLARTPLVRDFPGTFLLNHICLVIGLDGTVFIIDVADHRRAFAPYLLFDDLDSLHCSGVNPKSETAS